MNHVFLRVGGEAIHLKVYKHASQLYINSKIARAINNTNTPFAVGFDENEIYYLPGLYERCITSILLFDTELKKLGEAGIKGAEAGKKLREELR